MGLLTAEQAVEVLRAAGLRAARGYPGGRMPQIGAAAVAVNVERAEKSAVTLAARVCCPGHMGGSLCEDQAELVAEAWAAAGGVCRREACSYDSGCDLFSVRVLGTWAEKPEPEAEPFMALRAFINGWDLPYLTSVRVDKQSQWVKDRGAMGQDPRETLEEQAWTVTIEERLPSRSAERAVEDGFVLVLAEGNVAEQYTDCVWLSVCREDTVEGLRQVRVCQSWTRSLEEWKS